jgi:alkylation response protein AidB-like acyl-CoA dehydrogenase
MTDDLDLSLVRSSARGFLSVRRGNDEIVAMGWTAMLVEESAGGVGYQPVEASVVAEEMGRARHELPWSGSLVCAAALARFGGPDLTERWLPGLLDTTVTGAVVVAGACRGIGTPEVVVCCGDESLDVISGVAISTRPDPTNLDTGRDLRLFDIMDCPDRVAIGDRAAADEIAGLQRLLVASDAMGAASGARERLVNYLRCREAFGQPLASFQAIQHRLVDLLVFERRASAALLRAARLAARHSPQFPRAAAAAHAFVSERVVPAVDECIQLSGGIGFTWEYPLHLDLRRAFADTVLAGSARASRTAVLAELAK